MPEPPVAPNPTTAPEPRASVLLVDDEPANLLVLEALLDGLGLDLVRARTGGEALKKLAAQPFALVLLDVRMPGMDGLETAGRLRQREQTGRTPVIFVTGKLADELPVVEAYKLGAVDFLVKPLVPEIVRAKVAGFVELYEAKERARRQADQLRLLVQGTKDTAIVMLDPDGRIATWNAGAERLYGYTADEVAGRHFSVFYPPETIARGWPAEELRRATADGGVEDEGWRVRRDGSRFWSGVVITALRDEAGTLRGFSKVFRDLTERKKWEDSLRRMHEELEQRVRDRTADLSAANEALKEADRRKDEFLAMLAHELRNPLAPIRTGLQVLALPQADRAATDKVREMMVRQIQHMGRIVDDLLDVSRIHQRKVTLRRERLDLGKLVRLAVEDQRPAFDAAGVALAVDAPPDPVWVHGDQTRLTQVVGNLLHNALKFTDQGGSVAVRVQAPNGRATVAVRDTGLGIEPEMLARLFEPFAQADRSLARSKGGLGLGLALARGLTELHGGTIEAHSDGPGKGSEFVVRLPRSREPAALTEVPVSPSSVGKKKRVLVIEDNRDSAESLRTLLDLSGYEVDVAHTGPAGVEAAARFKPHAIVCDIGLPELDGYGVAEALRGRPEMANVRLIAVTGYGRTEDIEKARQAGFNQHLTKPVDPNELLEHLVTNP
jgi:PAS domain S-box-containing protein